MGKSAMMIEEQIPRPTASKVLDLSQELEEVDLANINNPQYVSMYAKPVFEYLRQIEVSAK